MTTEQEKRLLLELIEAVLDFPTSWDDFGFCVSGEEIYDLRDKLRKELGE